MRRKLFCCVCYGLLFFVSRAQSYSSDVELIEKKQTTAVVRTSGMHEKKKDATDMAVKSAFYTYFFSGIRGLNNDKPLLDIDNQTKYRDYLERFFEGGRYNNFVRSVIPVGETEKLRNKNYKVAVQLEFLDDALYRDLVISKLIEKSVDKITMQETAEKIILPSIMVVPYRNPGESFERALQTGYKRVAVRAVQEGFVEKGVETKDFFGRLEAAKRAHQYEQDESASSNDKMLLESAGTDVYVEVDIIGDVTADGVRVSMTLTARETATANLLATKQVSSRRIRTTAVDEICKLLAQNVREEFLQQIATAMAKKMKQGNSVMLHISIAKESLTDLDSEVGDAGIPLSDLIRIWVKKHAQNGSYHVQGSNSEKLIFDQIQVPNRASDGLPMDVNDFSLEIYSYLKGQGIVCDKKTEGNTVYIMIK